MKTATAKKVRVLSFGEGGHSELMGRHGMYANSTLSGYSRPENWRHSPDCDYSECIVIDKRPAIATESGYRWVFNGPMCNPDLADGAIDRLGEVSPLMAGAMAENSYGALLALHATHSGPEAGPLDRVSPAAYAAGWSRHGAKLGRIVDGAIVWDDDVIDPLDLGYLDAISDGSAR